MNTLYKNEQKKCSNSCPNGVRKDHILRWTRSLGGPRSLTSDGLIRQKIQRIIINRGMERDLTDFNLKAMCAVGCLARAAELFSSPLLNSYFASG